MAASLLQSLVGLTLVLVALGIKQRFPTIQRAATATQPSSANCTELWFTQFTDHFSWNPSAPVPETYQQRVFTYDKYFGGDGSPIFFYAGNEGDVTLYTDHTGLMWENAKEFKALIIFAEHRFYGKSQFTPNATGPSTAEFPYLTHEQAMADYVNFLYSYKTSNSITNSPVIVFGGSYGGMLACWLRLKYPSTFLGAIAASAPVRAFPGMDPAYDWDTYWQVVTRDASSSVGASAACQDNVRNSWPIIFNTGSTQAGRDHLSSMFGLCKPLESNDDVWLLAMWLAVAFDTMAMGDFPYPSNYLTSGGPLLPTYPVTAACEELKQADLKGDALLTAMRAATAVYNNATQSLSCYDLPYDDIEQDGIWDWQYCTEMIPQETYFTLSGSKDMFWSQAFNQSFINNHCQHKYGITPRPTWIRQRYGNIEDTLKSASNIVFSNGLLDPWSSGGITYNVSDTVQAIILEHGAHHLDLMFSDPRDPPDVTFAREFHMNNIRQWLKQ
eukprot:m.243329 g.243329  ORF g.243329 m.243329 type:complete len:499 (+) comp17462_c0_seq2:4261-5757(+)